MNRESEFYEQKKKLSIVHKPFAIGQINLFHRPKKNPNGHLASAKLHNKKIPDTESQEISGELLATEDLIDPKLIFPIEEKEANKTIVEAEQPPLQPINNSWLNGWKITAILLVIIGNAIAAIAIYYKQNQVVTTTIEPVSRSYTSGKTDLTANEFVELNLNNLKNIDPQSTQVASSEAVENSIENLPLAVPPSNLSPDIVQSQVKSNDKYYYILSKYTGDRSLTIAKTKVPNVSLVNFPQGMFIYMGAFTSEEPAKRFIKQLQEIGLEASVYPSN